MWIMIKLCRFIKLCRQNVHDQTVLQKVRYRIKVHDNIVS